MYDAASPDPALGQAALATCYLELGDRTQAAALIARAESIRAQHKRLAEQYTLPMREVQERIGEGG